MAAPIFDAINQLAGVVGEGILVETLRKMARAITGASGRQIDLTLTAAEIAAHALPHTYTLAVTDASFIIIGYELDGTLNWTPHLGQSLNVDEIDVNGILPPPMGGSFPVTYTDGNGQLIQAPVGFQAPAGTPVQMRLSGVNGPPSSGAITLKLFVVLLGN